MQNTHVEPPSSFWASMTRLVEGPVGWILTLIVIPGLFAAVLLLPPVNLLERLEAFAYIRITEAGGAVSDSDGTTVNFPAEGVNSSFSAIVESIPRADFMKGGTTQDIYNAASSLPNYLIPKSPLYSLRVRGTNPNIIVLTIPIPNDSLPYETLSLYNWTGGGWEHVPSQVFDENDIIEARLSYAPDNFMVMQTVPIVPEVKAMLELGQQLPEGVVVAGELVSGLTLRGDGALCCDSSDAPYNTGLTTPVIRNWEGSESAPAVRTDLINNMLIEAGQQDNQLLAVQDTVVQNNYPGVVLDYRGVDAVPSARADYVYLIKRMADNLHEVGKRISVRVERPRQISAESWDTGGYDWRALGSIVDDLIIPASVDPLAFQPGGEMDALLAWATSEVDRRKIQIELSVESIERSGPYLLKKGYKDAFRPLLGQIQVEESGAEISLTLDNPRLLSAVTWNDSLGMYSYHYQDDQGQERTVYIESAKSISHKLNLLQKYNIRKVSIKSPLSDDIDPKIWDVMTQFQNGQDFAAGTGRLDVFYAIYNANNEVVTQEVRPIDNSRFAFSAPGDENLRAEATIIGNNGQALTASLSSDIVRNALELIQSKAAVAAESQDAAPAPAPEPEFAQLSSGQIVNIRQGPGIVYPIVGTINPGGTYRILAKNDANDWWQIDFNNGNIGWVIGQLVNTAGDLSGIGITQDIPEPPPPPVVEEQPPPVVSDPEPPLVSAPPPSGGGSFGYGVQAHMVHNDQAGQVMNMTTNMGFNWVKQQIEWKVFESSPGNRDFGSSDGIVNAANNTGVNLLFSAVNAPAWAREPGFDGSVGGPPQDPQKFADFLGAMAGKYCGSSLKAIEVWNEQNLHYEWGNRPLNAAEYVALLAPSYAAIKGACPSMLVISGALTPAGNNPPFAADDFTYLEDMFKAGLNNYIDGIGAHPSGFNVPPSHTWKTACEAIQISGNSFNGACDSPHHSWSFRSTMEGYRNITNIYGAGNKLIWPTEFGWAAGGAFDPRYKYADDNDFNEQAQWTVEAYQMMKNWGWVGPAFLWNLNFRVVANGTEKAQWGIVDPGWSPLPIYNALQSMPK